MKFKDKFRELFGSGASRKGTYSAAMSLVVVAIALVLILLVNLLPDDVSRMDISSQKVYSTGEVTAEVLGGLENNISFTVFAEKESMDKRIEKLISQYQLLSDKISVEYIDPVVNPTKLDELGAQSNSILVKNEDTGKTDTVMFEEIIVYDEYSYYYSGQLTETDFDGEGQLTGAINYVTTETDGYVYTTSGHGETTLPGAIADRLEKLSLTTIPTTLLMDGKIQSNCSLLLMNAPQSDISEDEKQMISEYLDAGGSFMYVAFYEPAELPNLSSLLSEYGITPTGGYVADPARCYQENPYYIFPVINTSHEVVSSLSSDALALLAQSQGFELTDPASTDTTVSAFMSTSEQGVSVVGDTQTQGEFALGVCATKSLEGGKSARVLAIASESLIDEQILTSFPNLVNGDVFIDSVSWFLDDVHNISIPAKSLQITYNTVNGGTFWKLLYVFVIPLALFTVGFLVWNRRRKA